MRRVFLTLAFFLPLLLASTHAQAQTGWTRTLRTNADSLNGVMPPVNQPQAGWTPVPDIQSSDGTATVPTCDDPVVLATVEDGIIYTNEEQWPTATGGPASITATFSTVWVHPTTSNGTVCDAKVQLDVSGTGPEEWEFQPFATNGEVKVFFYDKDDQNN